MTMPGAPHDLTPTPPQLAVIRGSIRRTAARFHQWLSAECVDDLIQEVLLRLLRSGTDEGLLNCPPYLSRVAANVTVDMLRSRGAKKRQAWPTTRLPPRLSPWQHSRTPEEIMLAREEARRVLKTNRYLRSRVTKAIELHFPRGVV
jgi:DNA-directed RNA polymerase specialized sigma24 family protein